MLGLGYANITAVGSRSSAFSHTFVSRGAAATCELMVLTIEHHTVYRCARPVVLQPHRLVVTPRDSGELSTIESNLHCVPEANMTWTLDVFGNRVATATFAGPTDHLAIAQYMAVCRFLETTGVDLDEQAVDWNEFTSENI